MKDKLVIDVGGLPNSKVGLNSRMFYKAKNKIFQKEKKTFSDLLIMEGHRQDPLWEKVSLEFTFNSADKRHRDVDNLIGCAKPWIDALQGLVIPADDCRYLPRLTGEYNNEDVDESFTRVVIKKLK